MNPVAKHIPGPAVPLLCGLLVGIAGLSVAETTVAGELETYLRGEPAEAARAARTLETRVYGGLDEQLAAALRTALDGLLVEQLEEQPALPKSASLFDFLETAARMASMARAGGDQRPRELIRWIALSGTAAQVAALEAHIGHAAAAEAVIAALGSVDAPETAHALLRALENSRGTLRRAVIAACAQRGLLDAVFPLRVLAQTTPDDETRWACLEALSRLGVPPAETVPLGPGADPASAARYANANLRAALQMGAAGERAKARDFLYRFVDLYARRYQINAALLGLARLDSPNLTRAALRFVNTPGVRETAVRVLRESRDPGLEDTLTKAWPVTDPSMKAAILDILAARGFDALPALLHEARASNSPELRVTAARLSGKQAAAEDLIELADRGAPWTRGPALDDLLSLAEQRAAEGGTDDALPLFQRIASGRHPAAARRRAVHGLGRHAPPELASFVAQLRGDADIGGAADRAYVAITGREPDPEKARAALHAMATASPNEKAAAEAAALLAGDGEDIGALARARGYVLDWELLGPIPEDAFGNAGDPPFDVGRADPPRRISAGGEEYVWTEARAAGLPASVELPDSENHRVYALARVPAPAWIPATVVLRHAGANARLWFNGRLLMQGSADEALPAARALDFTLVPGINRFVVELVHRESPWSFSLQLAGRGGKPLDVSLLALPDDGARGAGVRVETLRPILEDGAP